MHSLETLFQSLELQGWAYADGVLPAGLQEDLLQECQKSWDEGLFHEAQIGKGQDKSRHAEIRGDSILWLDGTSPAQQRFLEWSDELRKNLNERYYLGLRSAEFHFARYPSGKGYHKHIDQHRGTQARQISFVLYLNSSWSEDAGGQLRIFDSDNDSVEKTLITPQPGRVVIFRSDSIPHEVLPCFQTRWSLTGWFRTDLR